MMQDRMFAAWLRPVAGLFALVAVLALGACGGGSGAPNNPYAPTPPVTPDLVVLPAAPSIYSQVAATLTISGGVAPYRAFSSNSAVLPVTQNLSGNTVTLLAGTVSALTVATITIQDSAGTRVSVDVTIIPGPATPPPALVVLPTDITVYSTVASQLTISGGVPPYQAFSNNSNVLPVAQNVSGNSLMLLATAVATSTPVIVTIKDSVQQTAAVNVTVRQKGASGPPLTVLPATVTTSKGVPTTLTISGGAAPYQAYSSNPGVAPVSQSVTGNSIVLVASAVNVSTSLAITVQDSAGQTAQVSVTVTPDSATPPPPLAILPASAIVFSGVPTTLSVTGGVPPYKAFSSNSAVLPVTQAVAAGGAIPLYATNVAGITTVTVTVQDSASPPATTAASVSVQPATLLNTLTVKPNASDCGTSAICSGQTGTVTVTLQLPGGGPAPGRQVRFDVVSGPYGIVTSGAPPTAATVPSSVVVSDAAGNAQVIVRANVDAPTQPAQIRVTDLTSGQQITGDFLIQQRTGGTDILSVVPAEVNIIGPYIGVCSAGFRIDYFVYGGTPPYRITQTFPTGAILLNSTVNASGGFFEVVTNGTCVKPEQFSIVDATGRQITASLINDQGTVAVPVEPAPSDLAIVPGDITGDCTNATFDFIVTGGTAPYNISASPRVGTSPTITPSNVSFSGGTTRIGNLQRTVTLSFVDSSRPQKTATRTITCAGSGSGAAALTVNPLSYNYTSTTCVGAKSEFIITGGVPPYTVAFTLPSFGSITPTTVPLSGQGFLVEGLANRPAGKLQTFITVTDTAKNQAFPSITCP